MTENLFSFSIVYSYTPNTIQYLAHISHRSIQLIFSCLVFCLVFLCLFLFRLKTLFPNLQFNSPLVFVQFSTTDQGKRLTDHNKSSGLRSDNRKLGPQEVLERNSQWQLFSFVDKKRKTYTNYRNKNLLIDYYNKFRLQ